MSWQEYWSGLPCPLPGDLPNPGVKPASPASLALGGGFFTTELPGKPKFLHACMNKLVSFKKKRKRNAWNRSRRLDKNLITGISPEDNWVADVD